MLPIEQKQHDFQIDRKLYLYVSKLLQYLLPKQQILYIDALGESPEFIVPWSVPEDIFPH